MKLWLKKILFATVTLFFIFVITNAVLAFTDDYKSFLEQAGQTGTYKVSQQGQPGFIDTFLGQLITIVVSFVGVFFLGLTIYSGFQWMTAGGNEEKVTKARTRVLNGVIGVTIALLAFVITNTLFNYFNERFLTAPQAIVEEIPQEPPIIERYGSCNEIPTDADCTGQYHCIWSVAESVCQLNVRSINNCDLLEDDCENINGQDCVWNGVNCEYRR